MAVRVRQGAARAQRRYFRPQGIAIPDEHMPPLEGTKAFDSEVNDYYTLRLNQSFWRKDLHAKFMSTSARESLRRRVHERQAHFDTIKLMTVHEKEEDGQVALQATELITQRFNEPPPPNAPFTQGDRILPHSGPMKHQPATVLGYREGLLWLQHDIHASPVPHHPSRLRSGWSLISRCKVAENLPEASDTHITLNTGSPVHMSKAADAEEDLTSAEEAEKAAQVPTTEASEPKAEEATEEVKAEELKSEEPKPEEPKAEEPKVETGGEVKAEESKAEEVKAEDPKAEVEEPKAEVEESKSEEKKAEELKPEEPKAKEVKPEESAEPESEAPKAEEPMSEEVKPEETKPEEPKVEEVKAEDPKPEEPKAEKEESVPEEPKS